MKTKNKLSPLDELRAERIRLKAESILHEENIKDNFSYLKGNLGSIIVSSLFSSVNNTSEKSFLNARPSSKGGIYDKFSAIIEGASAVLPGVWTIAQPIVIGLLTKKVSSFFFRKKKKK